MPTLAKRLPNLGALAFFEAAGRLTGFTRAAAELNVTQGAVSRQIRLLEDALGAPLFHRRHKTIELTADGRRLHRTVAMALDQIAEAADAFRAGSPGHGVTIAATSAFASLWLIPRLGRLRAAIPDVEVQVLATDLELHGVADRFDIGVRYGTGRWPGLTAELLGHTEVFPVCAPSYLAERGPFATPDALLRERLLFLDEPRRHWIDWSLWLRGVGVTGPPPRPALRADSFTVLVNAAVEGQGIALGWRQLVQGHLATGLLVSACETRLRPDHAFHLVTHPEAAPSAERRAVADWIVSAFRGEA
jgi:DNA-binding transcriptional LysR family regulator